MLYSRLAAPTPRNRVPSDDVTHVRKRGVYGRKAPVWGIYFGDDDATATGVLDLRDLAITPKSR